jgi:hypothetical protein
MKFAKEIFICAGDCTPEGIREICLSSLLPFESFRRMLGKKNV